MLRTLWVYTCWKGKILGKLQKAEIGTIVLSVKKKEVSRRFPDTLVVHKTIRDTHHLTRGMINAGNVEIILRQEPKTRSDQESAGTGVLFDNPSIRSSPVETSMPQLFCSFSISRFNDKTSLLFFLNIHEYSLELIFSISRFAFKRIGSDFKTFLHTKLSSSHFQLLQSDKVESPLSVLLSLPFGCYQITQTINRHNANVNNLGLIYLQQKSFPLVRTFYFHSTESLLQVCLHFCGNLYDDVFSFDEKGHPTTTTTTYLTIGEVQTATKQVQCLMSQFTPSKGQCWCLYRRQENPDSGSPVAITSTLVCRQGIYWAKSLETCRMSKQTAGWLFEEDSFGQRKHSDS